MAHIDVRGEGHGTLPDEGSAIMQVIALKKWSKAWSISGSFGQSIEARRKIDAAIKAKDHSAFKATQRRGHWRVTLA